MPVTGARSQNGWPHIDAVVHQAIGVLMQRNGTTAEQASATLHALAGATGRDVAVLAAEVIRSVSTGDADDD